MKIIKIANNIDLVDEMRNTLSQMFEKTRSDRDSHTPSDSILFSDQWLEITGQTPIEHWGGNFYSMLSIYNTLLKRGKQEKASKMLDGIKAQKVYVKSNEFWLNELDKFFGSNLFSKWQHITK